MNEINHYDFLITGLPRCGGPWLGAFLDSFPDVCVLHEPWKWPQWSNNPDVIESYPYAAKTKGVVDTDAPLKRKEFDPTKPCVILINDVQAFKRALSSIMPWLDEEQVRQLSSEYANALADWEKDRNVMHVHRREVYRSDKVLEICEFIGLPAPDWTRLWQFQNLNIQTQASHA